MVFSVLLVVAISCLGHTDAATRCFECVDMPHPQDCPTVTTCSGSESCYVEQFVTSGGQVLYNSGCMSIDRCQNGGKRDVPYGKNFLQYRNRSPIAKRQNPVSVTDIATCMQCCSGSFCNVEGCGTTAVGRLSRGPRCFQCSAQADPESCRDTAVCDRHEVCAIYKPLDRITRDEWATECMGEMQCNGIVKVESAQLASMVGKRDQVTVNKCPRCCKDDLCNFSCRQNITVTQTTAIPTPPPTHPPTHPPTRPSTHHPTHPPHTKPTTKPTAKTTAKPVTHTAKPTTKPTTKPTVKHVTHTPKPTTKPTTKPTVKHVTHTPKPTTKPTTKPTVKHVTHTQKPTTKPTTKPTVKHVTHTPKPTTKPTTKPTVKHVTHTPKPTTQQITHSTTTKAPVPTTDPAVGCKVDGYIYDQPTKLCLKFHESPLLNWTDAQDLCNATKGRLAIITDDQKIKDVLHFYKQGGYKTPLWVGATDFGNGHVFTFTDGSKLTVDPADGQNLKNANCLYVTGGSYKGFGPCVDKHGFICERSSTIRA